jgi:hypothetical protein
MIAITQRGGTHYVERQGRLWAKIVSGVLLAPWLLLTLLPLLTGYGFSPLDLVWTILLFVPAAALSFGHGRTKRHRVIAVTDARQVAGGTLVTVVDAQQGTHQLIVSADAAEGIADSLTGHEHVDGQ